ncbi:hypothetical protein [Asticcacaulis excentricus]|uniref:hypothetical protein n=1 Tax=Asticcacaulis excentricus TaxID=78587 RepID=UPI0001A793B9|nr:hypothetical protein [Asticcacaulis excentricus]
MPPEPKRIAVEQTALADSARPNLYVVSDSARGIAALDPRFSAQTPPVVWQWAALMVLSLSLISGLWLAFDAMKQCLYGLCWALFMTNATLRLTASLTPRRPHTAPPLPDSQLPVYTVIVALYTEAAIAPQLITALEALDSASPAGNSVYSRRRRCRDADCV